VDSAELTLFAGALESTGPSEMDHDCDQVVGGPDYGFFLQQLNAGQPGPSGLSCAGTAPCP